MSIRAGYGLSYDANLGAVTSQSRNVFPTFVPVNLDPNFLQPAGIILNSPGFLNFIPTDTALIQPGTLNTYNLSSGAFATGLGILLRQALPTPSGILSSNGLAFTLPEKNFKTSYGQHFLFSVERQFGNDFLASVGFVGTRGLHLTRFVTPNAGLISRPLLFTNIDIPSEITDSGQIRTKRRRLVVLDTPPATSPTAESRPQPNLGAYTVFQNSAASSYDSLQAEVEKRLSRGLQFRANWTWSHAIDEVSDPFDGRGFYALPQDSTQLRLERASANFDARQRFTWLFVWDLPGIQNNAVLRNWKWAAVGEFQNGQPFTVNTALDQNGDGNLTDRLDSMNGLTVKHGDPQLIRLDPAIPLSPTVVVPRASGGFQVDCRKERLVACPGENGRVGRNTFRADGIASIDTALWRTFKINERTGLDVRAEAFNVFNRTHFGIPVRILESPGFGHAFDTQTSPRSIRIAVKLSF
jgi:hypothetical protein